jgi:cobalt-zinc-cadmium efflux system protein
MGKNHDHGHSKQGPTTKVIIVLLLTATYMVAEAFGGYFSNSLSLMADAGHMLADVAALLISLGAFYLAARPPNSQATFGYHRAEVIAALFNGMALLVVSFFIIKEAVNRFFEAPEIETTTMMTVALGGLFINLISLFILHKDKSHNINLRGAWLHVMSDTLGSIGVVSSGLLIYLFGWTMADPVASIIIASLISYSALHLIFDTLKVLMEHVPSHINPHAVSEEILSIPAAIRIHDLHIWSITSGKDALSVHVVAQEGANYNQLLHDVQQILTIKFGIDHATIQIENQCPAPDKTC